MAGEGSQTWSQQAPAPTDTQPREGQGAGRGEGGTDLAIGTAGPAPSANLAAGLVIVAKVTAPTFHVPCTHARAMDQEGGKVRRVSLLFTGSGLHVAGVPSRAAVLAVLAAHGLGGTEWQ